MMKDQNGTLANPDDVRVIFLPGDDPKKYHKFAVAENMVGITRKMALRRLFQPLRGLERMDWEDT